jgi:hypothetical protein
MNESELDELMVLTYCKEQGQFQVASVVEERIQSIRKCKNKNKIPSYLFLCVFTKDKSPSIYIRAFSKMLNIKWDEKKIRWISIK